MDPVEPLPRTPRRNRTPDGAGGGDKGGNGGGDCGAQPQHVAEPLVPYLNKMHYRGGGYAILMAFHGPPDLSTSELSKHEIVRIVEDRNLCDGPFKDDWHAGVVTGKITPGWKSIDSLLKHKYVARTQGGRAGNMAGISDRFMLTASGRDFIPMMLRRFAPGMTTPPTGGGGGGGNGYAASHSGEKRPHEGDHLPSNSRSTKPNTERGHKLSNSKNPELTAKEAARQHWAAGTKVTDRCIEVSDDDDDDDDAESGSSVQTQTPMGAGQAEVLRPVLLACNAPATLSARAVSMRSLVCAGAHAVQDDVPVVACVDDHRGAR